MAPLVSVSGVRLSLTVKIAHATLRVPRARCCSTLTAPQ